MMLFSGHNMYILICSHIIILDSAGKKNDKGADDSSTTKVSTTANDTLNIALPKPFAITTDASQENEADYEGIEPDHYHSNTSNNLTFNNNAATLSTSIPTPPPPRQTQPGAVRVPGPDSDNINDDGGYSVSNATVSTNRIDPNNPVSAELIDEDKERRRIQEEIDREVAERERERIDQEREIPEAEVVTEKNLFSTRVKILSFAVVLLAIIAIVLGTVLTRETPTPLSKEVLEDYALLSSVSFDNGTALLTPSTPQNNALLWLANNANRNTYSNETKIQRYALAVLYYSTNGNGWDNKGGWMSDGDECNWYNREVEAPCKDGALVELAMDSNNLVGTIPNELALLSDSLGKLFFDIDCCVMMLKSHCLCQLFWSCFQCTLMLLACHFILQLCCFSEEIV